MSITTKRTICRSLFLLLGLLPFCGTVGYAAWRHVTFDSGGSQQWIAGQLGLDIQMAHTTHPKPGVVRFDQASVLDPETATTIANCDMIETKQSQMAVHVRIPSATIPQEKFSRLLHLLHERLLRQTRILDRAVFVTVDEVRLTSEHGDKRLTELRLEAVHGPRGPDAGVTFCWGESRDKVSLSVLRDHTVDPVTTEIDLMTWNSNLPCTLFCQLPANLPIGDQVTFRGRVIMKSHAHGWTGELTGGHLAGLETATPETLSFLETLRIPSQQGKPLTRQTQNLAVDFTIDHTQTVLESVSLKK